MSGIFGCWNLDDSLLDVDTFKTCLERISPARLRPSVSWHNGSVALGRKINPHSGPEDWSDICARNVACVFDGRLDNRAELLAMARDDSLDSSASDCDLVRAAYGAFGDDFVDRLRGDFTCALFDLARKRLIVARDRLGVRPLCFAEANNTFLFASEAKALLA